jgi:hypothetical protein
LQLHTGKWYCEFYLTSVSDAIEFGVVDVSVPSTTLRPASGQSSLYALKSTNADRTYLDAGEQANLGSPDFADAGNIVSMAYDIDAGTVTSEQTHHLQELKPAKAIQTLMALVTSTTRHLLAAI